MTVNDLDRTESAVDRHVVHIRGLTKRFGEQRILDDFDLEVKRGEFVALVGRSGTGKTTLLRILTGLESAGSGRLRVAERASVVFQDARLIAAQRVWKNVVLGDLRAKDAYERALESLREVGLEDKAKAWPKTLSGGEAQRVALARALFRSPDLLLLDEPFGALDAFTRAKAQELVISLWEAHSPGVVLVTHDIEEAISLADRVLVLGNAEIRGDITVRPDRPRDVTSTEFNAIKRQVIDLLGDKPGVRRTSGARQEKSTTE
jgi:sulfonate transport system ATP-binding protein